MCMPSVKAGHIVDQDWWTGVTAEILDEPDQRPPGIPSRGAVVLCPHYPAIQVVSPFHGAAVVKVITINRRINPGVSAGDLGNVSLGAFAHAEYDEVSDLHFMVQSPETAPTGYRALDRQQVTVGFLNALSDC